MYVMAGLVPAIHVLLSAAPKTWMPGIKPGMTSVGHSFGDDDGKNVAERPGISAFALASVIEESCRLEELEQK